MIHKVLEKCPWNSQRWRMNTVQWRIVDRHSRVRRNYRFIISKCTRKTSSYIIVGWKWEPAEIGHVNIFCYLFSNPNLPTSLWDLSVSWVGHRCCCHIDPLRWPGSGNFKTSHLWLLAASFVYFSVPTNILMFIMTDLEKLGRECSNQQDQPTKNRNNSLEHKRKHKI